MLASLGLNWGIEGAGWATVIAKVLLLALAIRAVRKESDIQIYLRHVKIDKEVMKEILKVAWHLRLVMAGRR